MYVLYNQSISLKTYFKENDKKSIMFTANINDAKRFNTKDEAIDFNHDNLFGECEYECTHERKHDGDIVQVLTKNGIQNKCATCGEDI